MQEDNLRKQEESVAKQEAMRRSKFYHGNWKLKQCVNNFFFFFK